ncbi:MAG: hypothetical protein MK212_05350 [Saprospiraceae bacterium]|nr:hypothetical protein [Saprospiraceae bacterium]
MNNLFQIYKQVVLLLVTMSISCALQSCKKDNKHSTTPYVLDLGNGMLPQPSLP